MCGIFGIYGKSVTPQKIHEGLKKLQYRGYDSWGYVVGKDHKRFTGKIPEVFEFNDTSSKFGMGHTRWATHGNPSELKNTHPIQFGGGKWFVVHNGIIQNYKDFVTEQHTSDTDTEVLVSLADTFYKEGCYNLKSIVEKIVNIIEGTYAFILFSPTYFPDEVIATCKGSPLILCESEDTLTFTSDQVTLNPESTYVYAKHGDIIHVKSDGSYEFVTTTKTHTRNLQEEVSDDYYEHHMLREILEQPKCIRNMLKGRIHGNKIKFGDPKLEFLKSAKTWVLIGCGSSYNACLVVRPFLEKYMNEKNVHVELASDFVLRKPFVDTETTAYIVVSQSGETRDCIAACEYITDECFGSCFGINNRPGSLLDSKTCAGIHLNIGTEKSVPATKSFTATLIALMMFSGTTKIEFSKIPDTLESHIKRVTHESSQFIRVQEPCFILGDSWGLGLAKEFALKLQEVAYIKAIYTPGFEMKHGPLALLENNSSVFYYGPSGSQIPDIIKCRGANLVHASEHNSFMRMLCDVITMQLVTYYTALETNLPIDTPRNLAKSVTV